MIKSKKVLAFIPARGGSKGILHKNLVKIGEKSLLQIAIEEAQDCPYIDEIVVSTDDLSISEKALLLGAKVPYLRPKYLATDEAKTIDAMEHMLHVLAARKENYDIIILLQPTSPFRKAKHITEALQVFVDNGMQGVVSVNEVKEHPILMRSIKNGVLENLLPYTSTMRRQDFPKYYRVNGAIYINKAEDIYHKISLNDNPCPYIMDVYASVDIDTEEDLIVSRLYWQERQGNIR